MAAGRGVAAARAAGGRGGRSSPWAYEEARAERDELAAKFARVYPPLAAQLADLLGRLRASDDRIEYMNAHALPRGCEPLKVAELVARGLDGWVQNWIDIPRIARRVQLPAFEYDAHHPYAWPRSSSVDAGSLMFRAICVRALPRRRCA
jgi:hypothetical protein